MTIRVGLAGYGFGGRSFHAPLIASAAGVELAGVVTRSPVRRAELERDHPGMPAFDSLAELAAAGAQAVAISTPADTHVLLTLEAIGLGLGVVTDKPFALDAASAREAVEAAEQAGVPLSPLARPLGHPRVETFSSCTPAPPHGLSRRCPAGRPGGLVECHKLVTIFRADGPTWCPSVVRRSSMVPTTSRSLSAGRIAQRLSAWSSADLTTS